jgi:hypothetical protein
VTVDECAKRLGELRVALSSTKTLLSSETGVFNNDFVLKKCCVKYVEEIELLEELLYNGELEDSRSGEV